MSQEIRIGKISTVDYATGMVRVVYTDRDGAVTRPLPLLSHEYAMPAVGDQVLVLHLSNGTVAGMVMGRPWSDQNAPPEGAEGLYRKDFDASPGVAMLRYMEQVLAIVAPTIKLGDCLTVGESATMNGDMNITGIVTITGTLNITGALAVSGDISAANVTASGDVTAGGISLKNHTHSCTCALSSGTTSAPQ